MSLTLSLHFLKSAMMTSSLVTLESARHLVGFVMVTMIAGNGRMKNKIVESQVYT